MKNESKLIEICFDIYRELYANAEPKADFDSLCSAGIVKQADWFLAYYLDMDKQKEIIEKHCKKNRLNKYDRAKVMTTIMLGCSPTSNKKAFNFNKK